MAAVAPARLAALKQLRCAVFQTSYNPTSARTGAKYLRARLRGPSMVGYYPQTETSLFAELRKAIPHWNFVAPEEEQRLEDVEALRRRGKGPPKKAKSKADSRRAHRKR